MGSCQNYGPFWGTLNNRCRIIIGTPKGTIILTTTQIFNPEPALGYASVLSASSEGSGGMGWGFLSVEKFLRVLQFRVLGLSLGSRAWVLEYLFVRVWAAGFVS